ncbi:MAG: hypothetical protein CMN30_04720 [Sandaracinus sp.]|nr:hypothetical protein [Sandaracinus sp.]
MLPAEGTLGRLAATLASADRPLMVAGPAPLAMRDARRDLERLRRALGAPLLADAASQQVPTLACGDLAGPRLEPDLILQVGRAPVGGRLERWVAGRRRVVLAGTPGHGWPDPSSDAEAVILGDLAATVGALAGVLPGRPASCWNDANAEYARAVEAAREEHLEGPWHEGHVLRTALARWPEAGLVVLGNSLPIRHADLWASPPRAGVLHQRGVSGIDGLVAGAAGAAVASDAPTLCVLGDVSFLHDLGGLSVARRAPAPLVVLVVDNDGGRIFERLPIHDALGPESFERLFTMGPGIDVAHAAATFGIPFARATDAASLNAALQEALGRPGPTVVHAPATGSRAADRALADTIAALPLPEGLA